MGHFSLSGAFLAPAACLEFPSERCFSPRDNTSPFSIGGAPPTRNLFKTIRTSLPVPVLHLVSPIVLTQQPFSPNTASQKIKMKPKSSRWNLQVLRSKAESSLCRYSLLGGTLTTEMSPAKTKHPWFIAIKDLWYQQRLLYRYQRLRYRLNEK